MIRALLLEDDRSVAEAAAEALESRGIKVIGIVGSLDEVLARAASESPDVIVADIDISGEMALGLSESLPPDGPGLLWWSGHGERYRPGAALAGGAGYVSKRAGFEELADAIRRVAAGEVIQRQADLRAVRDAPKAPSAREHEVLVGVAAGLSNKEIATKLEIGQRTVESHLRRMFDRYGVSSRIALPSVANQNGWV